MKRIVLKIVLASIGFSVFLSSAIFFLRYGVKRLLKAENLLIGQMFDTLPYTVPIGVVIAIALYYSENKNKTKKL